jgi:hypothetical protein
MRVILAVFAMGCLAHTASSMAAQASDLSPPVKVVLKADNRSENLLKADAWRSWANEYRHEGELFVCDNGSDAKVQRGVGQIVVLNQSHPEPIVASAESKAEDVGGSPDNNYAVYLDLVFVDGTHLWGQASPFACGAHDWQRREVFVLPEKPVKQVSFYMLLRSHSGRAWFRQPALRVVKTPASACLFDGVPVIPGSAGREGFQVRDVAAGSDFLQIDRDALGLTLQTECTERDGTRWIDATLSDTTGKDRAVTLLYAVRVAGQNLKWLQDPRKTISVEPRREYVSAHQFRAGSNGRLSRYPLGAVTDAAHGTALGIDMSRPALFRIAYNAGTEELYLAYDVALTPEKPRAGLCFCHFSFSPEWGFRAALARYYELFPDHFRCRTPQQGLWMPFAKISKVKGWEDFGFMFKEGNDETTWDDEHGILTFRYTEPMTWWMPMPKDMPRTLEAALTEAKRLAEQKGNAGAKALLTSGFHNAEGQCSARLLDRPWCNGAVWSMNSMPGIEGEVNDFRNKWNADLRQRLYGPQRRGDLDGEYVDSSEGYVTDELDFRREHFAAAETPLTFSPEEHKPAIFRGLVAFEYVRGIANDVHAMNKLMMANGAPTRVCWLAPLLEVMGTETNWHTGNRWQPMSDTELLYRRALCKGKPYCFLMNTRFEDFSSELVEKYMKRSLAYGMFPGFFSHNASQGHYFNRPELYERDRPLFKKYVPLCKRVAEAGWEPVTRARSSDEHVYVERFGDRYLTVFNDSSQRRTAVISLDGRVPASSFELLGGEIVAWREGKTTLVLGGEDVAVIDLNAEPATRKP